MKNHALGFIFPGQGSQSLGMLSGIAEQYNEVAHTFTEASDVLHYDLWQLVQNGPAVELDKTVNTQPALLTASFAIWRILTTRMQMRPALFAGHSLGEYTALVCANALAFQDAVKLVHARGQFMQEAVNEGTGAMAAIIGLDDSIVAAICQQALTYPDEVLSPANFNSVGQVVVAGHKTAVERAIVLAKEQGAKLATLIPVSVPSHCKLMEPAAKRLAALLNETEFTLPDTPVINNVDVLPYQSIEEIRQGLIKQLYSPVRWVETIHYFIKAGVTQLVECGPGKVLTGLNKRIDKNLQTLNLAETDGIEALLKRESERNV